MDLSVRVLQQLELGARGAVRCVGCAAAAAAAAHSPPPGPPGQAVQLSQTRTSGEFTQPVPAHTPGTKIYKYINLY